MWSDRWVLTPLLKSLNASKKTKILSKCASISTLPKMWLTRKAMMKSPLTRENPSSNSKSDFLLGLAFLSTNFAFVALCWDVQNTKIPIFLSKKPIYSPALLFGLKLVHPWLKVTIKSNFAYSLLLIIRIFLLLLLLLLTTTMILIILMITRRIHQRYQVDLQ